MARDRIYSESFETGNIRVDVAYDRLEREVSLCFTGKADAIRIKLSRDGFQEMCAVFNRLAEGE